MENEYYNPRDEYDVQQEVAEEMALEDTAIAQELADQDEDERPSLQGYRLPKCFKFVGKPNLAEDMSQNQLEEIGSEAMKKWEEDKGSRAHREERLQKALEMAMQVIEEKNYPWPKASNVKYPLLTVASVQFGAKCYPAMIQNGEVVKGKIIGKDVIEQPVINPQTGQPEVDPQTGEPATTKVKLGKQERADRISTFMNWQLLDGMKGWEEDTDKLCHILPIAGCLFRKTYYEELTGRPISHIIFPTDIYVRYDARGVDDASCITHALQLTSNEIIERQRAGLYIEEGIQIEGTGDGGLELLRGEYATGHGTMEDVSVGQSDEYLILEQHTWLDLDDDGYKEPYIVTMLHSTGQVLRIVARYSKNDVMFKKSGEVVRIKAKNYFTKYGFLPSPDGGIYDIGFGEILYPINASMNTTLNMLIDAGHLSNMGGGFIGGDIRIRAGGLRFRSPGEYKIVTNMGSSLRDNIVQLNQREPSTVLFSLLQFLNEAGRDIASIKDILSGEVPVNAPATTTIAMIEQGLGVFKSIYKRIHRSLKEELKKIYDINYMFLDDDLYREVLEDPEATIMDFANSGIDIVPVSDPALVSDMQKMARVQALTQFLNDPMVDQVELHKRILEGYGIEDVDELVVEPQPPAPDPAAEMQLQNVQLQGQLLQEQISSLQAQREIGVQRETREQFKTLSDMQTKEISVEADAAKKSADSVKVMAEAVNIAQPGVDYVGEVEEAKRELTEKDKTEEIVDVEQPQTAEPGIPGGAPVPQAGGMGPVETPPVNEGVPQVP